METTAISTDNLVACVACGQNTNRIRQVADELQNGLSSVREEALREIDVLRRQLEELREQFDSTREVNGLWDGS